MTHSPVLLTMTVANDIIWRYVTPVTIDNNSKKSALIMRWFSQDQLLAAKDIYIELKSEDKDKNSVYSLQPLKFDRLHDGVWYFDIAGEPVVEKNRVFKVDYKGNFFFKFIDEHSVPDYLQKAVYENMREKNSVAYQIKNVLIQEVPDNRNLLRMMLELSNKMDDILWLLGGRNMGDDFLQVRGMAISAQGLFFYYPNDIKDGTLAYTKNVVGEGEDRFTFASVAQIYKYRDVESGAVYEAVFKNINENTVDMIMRFLFSKEREILKDLRDK